MTITNILFVLGGLLGTLILFFMLRAYRRQRDNAMQAAAARDAERNALNDTMLDAIDTQELSIMLMALAVEQGYATRLLMEMILNCAMCVAAIGLAVGLFLIAVLTPEKRFWATLFAFEMGSFGMLGFYLISTSVKVFVIEQKRRTEFSKEVLEFATKGFRLAESQRGES